MDTVKMRFEAKAAAWNGEGRPEAMLTTHDWLLIQLSCWVHSPGGRSDGVSQVLGDYLAASLRTKSAGWEDRVYAEKDNCSRCGETYRNENLQSCTDCSRGYCYQCVDAYPVGANGNRVHACGGEIVG